MVNGPIKKAVRRRIVKKVVRKAVKRRIIKKAIKRRLIRKAIKRKIVKKIISRRLMKKVYAIVTPAGRSIISIKNDPRKALHKNKPDAMKILKEVQKRFNIRLRIKSLMIPHKIFSQNF